jgi:hypothetical protein
LRARNEIGVGASLRLDALHARFRDHTMNIFKNHGMTNIGYRSPEDAPLKQNTLIYILAHPSREAAAKKWQVFQNDPEWQRRERNRKPKDD